MTLQKRFSSLLEQCLENSKKFSSMKEVFDAFIHLNFLMCYQSISKHPMYLHYIDQKHLSSLKNKEFNGKELSFLLKASFVFYQMIQEAKPFENVLGDLYDENLGEVLGQFLTPKDLSMQLAYLCVATVEKISEPITIGDNCGCGAGSLILAQLQVFYEKFGRVGLSKIGVIGMDIDERMVQLTSLQIMAHITYHHIPLRSLSMFYGDTIKDGESEETLYLRIQRKKDNLMEAFLKLDETVQNFVSASDS